MPFRLKISLLIVALVVLVIAIVPLFVAPGEPSGTKPLAEVAGPGTEYVEVAGVGLHVVRYAADEAPPATDEPLFLLLHGFPFSAAAFDELGPLLADHGDVVAVDLPGFGLSERPLGDELAALRSRGLDPYSPGGQVRLVAGLLAELGATEVVLLGQDSGARLALDVALALEGTRSAESGGDTADQGASGVVTATDEAPSPSGLVLVGASPYTSSSRSWLARTVMNSPQLERLGPVFLRQIAQEPGLRILRAGWHDPTAIEQADLDAYQRPWTVEGWDDALWQLTKADAPPSLEGSLGGLEIPTLVVAGEVDGVVPTSESERLAAELPHATLELVPECGHAVQQECPGDLAAAVATWLAARP